MINFQKLTDAQLIALLNDPRVIVTLIVLAVWALIWKGIALWKAVQNKSLVWYVVLLAANTFGILEIIYIFFFSKKRENIDK